MNVGKLRFRRGEGEGCRLLHCYLEAYQYRRPRIQALCHVARYYRARHPYQLAYLFARTALDAPCPEDLLFVERANYDYELPLEYALCLLGRTCRS